MKRVFKRIICAFMVLALVLPIAYSEASAERGADSGAVAEYQTFEELSGKTISMLTGAPFEELISSKVSDVKEFTYYQSSPDMMLGIKSSKTDAGFMNNAVAELVVNRDSELAIFPEPLGETAFGFGFAKGDERRDEWQAAYDTISDETKEALWDKWTGADEDVKTLPEQDWPGENGTVNVAACDTLEPMSYVGQDGEVMGFDIEMILLIAEQLDVHVNFIPMDFSAVLSCLESDKADIITGSIVVTNERKETMDFLEYYPAYYVLIVRSVDTADASDMTAASTGAGEGVYTSISELADKTIGIEQGSIYDAMVSKILPDAQLLYYLNLSDQINALKAGKIDSFAIELPSLMNVMKENSDITYINEMLEEEHFGFVFPKTDEGAALKAQFDEFLTKITQDGTFDEMNDLWFGDDDEAKVMEDYTSYPATNGTLKFATRGDNVPFEYVKDGVCVGLDVDIAARFCKEYGYRMDLEIMDFGGILPAVQTSKSDFAGAGITITEERRESVYFSEPYYTTGSVFAVMKKDVSDSSFLSGIRDSFEKTFIREDRYKLFLSGILSTLLITVLSVIFGTALGFLIYMLCRNGNRIANAFSGILVWLVHGMPVVVLLMILYYIIFANAPISGEAVSVVAFTLIFAVAMYGMLKSGVGAIDIGQKEAAYALGYGDMRTFFRIILPQALPHFLPTYKAEIVSLIKATAIVGYIAVQDLTKMGDIVRGRTFEAFFPLIAVAVIYFILGGLLTFIVNRIEININPKRRNRDGILKGVKTDD